jgi:serine/threonine protein kinase/tetratricopeptide (TPR) repeat protein
MEILGEALELPPQQRPEFLDQACEEQADVRAEVERLLKVESDAPQAIPTEHGTKELAEALAPLKQVGPYKIIRTIGKGGMGEVFLAEQEHPVRRQVALKIVRLGMDSRQIVNRFMSERQALAMMNHPNVAHVYDAGATETGRPYFVMEYVDGLPITTFCDKHRLSTRQRLELIIDVCQAVHHAHTKGILHRDLKPSNVLVVAPGHGQKPLAKVIDFGIAKALNPVVGPDQVTMLTETGLLMGTPEYISPEQAEGSLDVDTRSDVYSVGVLLYQLLTGSLPMQRKAGQDLSYNEVLRLIREAEPPRPSTRIGNLDDQTSQNVASLRKCDTVVLRKQLRGDLDWITLKALEKDREHRYDSAAELAADIERHLHDQPVIAGPPTAAYRVRKFVRRHRGVVVTAALVLLALIGGMIGTGWQTIRARRAERTAIEQQQIAQKRFDELRKLVGSSLFQIDEAMTTQGPTKARQLLVQTSLRYLDSLARESQDPLLQRELMQGYVQVGQVQFYPGMPHLGDPNGALQSYRKAREIADTRVAAAPEDRQALKDRVVVLTHLAEAQAELTQNEDALKSFGDAIALCEALAGSDPDPTLARRNIAVLMHKMQSVYRRMGDTSRALEMAEKALALREKLLMEKPGNPTLRRDLFASHETLAALKANLGLPAEAVEHCDKTIEYTQAALKAQPNNPLVVRDASLASQRLAEMLVMVGRPGAALAPADEGITLHTRIVESDKSNYENKRDLANALGVRGEALLALGRSTEGLESFQKSLVLRTELGETNPSDETVARGIARARHGIAQCLRELGQLDEAYSQAQQVRQIHEARLKANPSNDAIRFSLCELHATLGSILTDKGSFNEAIAEIHKAISEYPSLTETGPKAAAQQRDLTGFYVQLAEAQARNGQSDQAAAAYRSAIELCDAILKISPEDRAIACQKVLAEVGLARLRIARKELDKVTLETAIEAAHRLASDDACGIDARLAEWLAQVALAELRTAQGKPDEARAASDRASELGKGVVAIDPANVRYRAMLTGLENH